ncbi:MAG: trypsin-like peptidase domain-containing protein [Verrucomicrobiaceae bacterium]|nr:trypsin-like peptidase domain-containing protein [Verrucomicrobiaceae bacterium]
MNLFKPFFTQKCTNCGERIEKAAKFCRHCGAGRAESWRSCNACGVSVAADSAHCWSCNADLFAQPRDQIFSDRWRRTPGVFATRVTIETPQERLRNGIQVDEGTQGALYKDGVMKTELAPGYHTQSSFWTRLTGGGSAGGFVEAVIAASDPVSSFVSLSETSALFTRDFAPVDAAVLVRVRLGDFGIFTRRLMPTGTDIVRDDDLVLPMTARVAEVVRSHLSKLTVGEVARSVSLRNEIEAALGQELPRLLEGYGLEYCGVEDIRLDSKEISRVREAEGDLTQTSRELEWGKMKRELEQGHKLGEIKDEFAFKEQLEQWTHEYTLTGLERRHIEDMRRIQLAETQGTAHAHATGRVEHVKKDYEVELKRKDRDWEDEEDLRDLKLLDEMRKRQFEAMEKLQKLKLEKQAADAANTVHIGQGLKDVPSHVAAGLLGPQVVAALEALRPQPQVTIIQTHGGTTYPGVPSYASPSFTPSYMPVPPPVTMGVGAPPANGTALEVLAQRYLPSVGVVVIGKSPQDIAPVGTAWIAAHRNAVVTNAHVAQEIVSACEDPGMLAWIIFSGQTAPVQISAARLHPEYGQAKAKGHPVASFDVAVLDLAQQVALPGLPLANRPKAYGLRELQSVAYIGFPMENLAGGGTSLQRPKAVAKKGSISSLEDWYMRHADEPARRQLIKHDLGVAGGASGSPMFDEAGDVVGIISAGNMDRLFDPQTKEFRRIPSGVMLNFAQRIDVLLDWMVW